MNRRKIGRMLLSMPLIDKIDFEEMLKITSKFVVVRCEYLYHKDCLEYIAICPEFDEVETGSEPPIYSVQVTTGIMEEGKNPEIVDIKFIREKTY